jgi:hypothetical protein
MTMNEGTFSSSSAARFRASATAPTDTRGRAGASRSRIRSGASSRMRNPKAEYSPAGLMHTVSPAMESSSTASRSPSASETTRQSGTGTPSALATS